MKTHAVKRYEIWWAEVPGAKKSHAICGRRPVIIVSNDDYNEQSNIVSVVPLTTKLEKRQLPTHVYVHMKELTKDSRALCEQILTLDKRRLYKRIGVIDDWFMKIAIQHAMAEQLSICMTA